MNSSSVKTFLGLAFTIISVAAAIELYKGDFTGKKDVPTVVPFIPSPKGPISQEDKIGIAKIFHTNVPDEANYAKGTPAYDLMAITNMKKFIEVGSKQKVAVIGFDVMNLWLENSKNRTIVSISPIDRGIQGTTSSFLVVYTE